ncbi:MAG TPA: 4-hydroxy-tetrahydrodipicolinate reductase [Bacteroidales bacterium]|nr:4-hydroxy-tetrahydrodipicolinate reductase [Bacteroidales bacterium]
MKIAILGYGKMGQEVERLAVKLEHEVVLAIDSDKDWETVGDRLGEAGVAIDFSMPEAAVENIYRCFQANVPLVEGTTGWYDKLEQVIHDCRERNQALFYGTNFSIGVNLFFEVNRNLAKLMQPFSDYEISIEETHHITKKDSPSGTAIQLANDILRNIERKARWVKEFPGDPSELGIKSYRTENVPGTHVVRYDSDIDTIEIIHTAKNRRGFALGALMAAEFLQGRKGVFEMKDLLSSQKLTESK